MVALADRFYDSSKRNCYYPSGHVFIVKPAIGRLKFLSAVVLSVTLPAGVLIQDFFPLIFSRVRSHIFFAGDNKVL